ncbi:MAG: hypothetical protein RO257_00850 [Candidatus Kapabacteria bacterium]|nr:hypothetical protein [Candidatus Kapabacteria bacterium]
MGSIGKDKENSFKDKCMKYASTNYLWTPLLILLVTFGVILFLINSQNNYTKEYVYSIIKVIKQDTTKYKLDSLTNHRLITLEINQSSYSNNIAFYSIFISILITIVILVIGFSVYFNNKENVKKLEDEQKKLDNGIIKSNLNVESVQKIQNESNEKLENLESYVTQSEKIIANLEDKQIILNDVIDSMKKEQIEFKKYIDENKVLIEKIVGEQEYFHFEIFDTLSTIHHSDFINYQQQMKIAQSIMSLSNFWTYFNISRKFIPDDRRYIYESKKYLNQYFEDLNSVFMEKELIEEDSNFTQNFKYIIFYNLRDSLKFIEDKEMKERVAEMIKIFNSYKTNEGINQVV